MHMYLCIDRSTLQIRFTHSSQPSFTSPLSTTQLVSPADIALQKSKQSMPACKAQTKPTKSLSSKSVQFKESVKTCVYSTQDAPSQLITPQEEPQFETELRPREVVIDIFTSRHWLFFVTAMVLLNSNSI